MSAQAKSWSTAEDISSSLSYTNVASQVAVNPSGSAVAVWYRYGSSKTIVQASTRAAGVASSWSTPVDLSDDAESASVPQVAIDPSGNAVAVWKRYDGSKYIIQASTLPSGGSWSAPSNLSIDGQNADEPQIAVDPSGNAVAVWKRYDGSRDRVQAATRPSGGSWTAASSLSASGQTGKQPQVAVDAGGDTVVVWVRWDGVTGYVTQAATRPSGGSWTLGVNISTPGGDPNAGAGWPQVAVDSTGNAVAVWQNANFPRTVKAATLPDGGSWSSPSNVSAASANASTYAQVAVDSDGDAVVVWSDGSYPYVIKAATRPSGGSWSSVETVSIAGQSAVEPQLTINPNGDAVTVWGYAWPNPAIDASTLPAGGSWSTPATLTDSGRFIKPQVSSADNGDVVAVWANDLGTNSIQASIYALFPPVSTAVPAISGTPHVGLVLPCSQGSWANDPTGYSYQWERDGSSISGATSSTYALVDADASTSITCNVTASNAGGSNSVSSIAVDAIGVPVNTAPSAIGGIPSVGQELTCSLGTWGNSPTSYTYQWNRVGSAISGATSSTYTIVGSDAGSAISCTVTAENDAGSSSATSSTTSIPAPSAPAAPALDITPPVVTIYSGPGSVSRGISAIFAFQANEDRVGFECQLDNEGWGPCGSPEVVYGLALGPHSFQVRAQDRAGNTGLPVTWTWVVDRRAPKLDRSSIKKGKKGKKGKPAAIRIKDLATISGLASDDADIKKVKLKLKITNPRKKLKKKCAYFSLKSGRRLKHACKRSYTMAKGTNRWSLSLPMKVRKRMRSRDRYRLKIQITDSPGNQKTYGVSFRVKK